MIAGKSWIRNWINEHPAVWEFILFNVLSNVATIVNFIAMWICTGFLFVSLENIPFQFFVFHYTQVESDLTGRIFKLPCGNSSSPGSEFLCAEKLCIPLQCGVCKSRAKIYLPCSSLSHCICSTSRLQPGIF